MKAIQADTTISFEQYAEWARIRYPGFRNDEELTQTEDAVYAPTEAPASSDACPVTVKSNQNGYVVVTPRPRGSR